jgi:hypothetical protein
LYPSKNGPKDEKIGGREKGRNSVIYFVLRDPSRGIVLTSTA